MTLKLLDFEQPLEPVEFPNGHAYAVKPLDAAGYELLQQVEVSRSAEAAMQLLRLLLPGVSDADLSLLTPRMVTAIVMHARHQLDLVLTALKNGGAPAAMTTGPRRRSKRKTPSARSSPG